MQQIPTIVLEQLIKGLETTQDQLQKNSVQMAELRGEVKGLTKEVEKVNHILRGDNGSSSLLSRMTVIETVCTDVNSDVEKLKLQTKDMSAIESWVASQKAANRVAIEGKWKLYAAAIPGILALISVLVTTFLVVTP